jgi:hypothetical protein
VSRAEVLVCTCPNASVRRSPRSDPTRSSVQKRGGRRPTATRPDGALVQLQCQVLGHRPPGQEGLKIYPVKGAGTVHHGAGAGAVIRVVIDEEGRDDRYVLRSPLYLPWTFRAIGHVTPCLGSRFQCDAGWGIQTFISPFSFPLHYRRHLIMVEVTQRLHVAGLTPSITAAHLRDRFAIFGKVGRVEEMAPDALGVSACLLLLLAVARCGPNWSGCADHDAGNARHFTYLTISATPAQLKKCTSTRPSPSVP